MLLAVFGVSCRYQYGSKALRQTKCLDKICSTWWLAKATTFSSTQTTFYLFEYEANVIEVFPLWYLPKNKPKDYCLKCCGGVSAICTSQGNSIQRSYRIMYWHQCTHNLWNSLMIRPEQMEREDLIARKWNWNQILRRCSISRKVRK